MRTSIKLKLLALTGMMVFCQPSMVEATDAPKKEKAKKEHKAVVPKHCPAELTSKNVEEFSKNKKCMINNQEFNVGAKFDKQAGKRYLDLNKAGKTPATMTLKSEKVKAGKVACLYTYDYKGPSKKKELAGKEVDRKGRIRIFKNLDGKAAKDAGSDAKQTDTKKAEEKK